MFEKSPFHTAMRDLEKAEKELDRQRSKLPEVDAIIAEIVSKRDALARRLEELDADDGPVDSIADALAELDRERSSLTSRVAELTRFQEIRHRKVAEATVAVLAAEANAHAAQAKHYVELERATIARALSHCLPVIRELHAATAAAEYHRNLAKGDSHARQEANAVDGLTLLVNEIGKLEQGAVDVFDIEKPAKGAPPILAVHSQRVADEDRCLADALTKAEQLDRGGEALLAAQRKAAKIVLTQREKVDMAQADMAMFDLRRNIENLERTIEDERRREYPVNVDNSEKVRQRKLERLRKTLDQNREVLAGWESKIAAAAA